MNKRKSKCLLKRIELSKIRKKVKRSKKYNTWRKYRNRNINKLKKENRAVEIKRLNIKDKHKHFVTVKAPRNCLVNENTEEYIEFINKIENVLSCRKKVFLQMKDIENIDYGSIVILLSTLIKFKENGIDFNGQLPKDNKLKEIMINSNFFKHLKNKKTDEIIQDKYNISIDGIKTHSGKTVDSVLSARIIENISKKIWGTKRELKSVQRILIELMHNTNNHAAIGATGTQHWWLSTKYMEQENKVCFAFLDLGVGIFENLNQKIDKKTKMLFKDIFSDIFIKNRNNEILEGIMKRQFQKTSTNQPFRGKGLPSIAKVVERKKVSNLLIITNDVIGKVSDDKYLSLKGSFKGTYVYWEVGVNNDKRIKKSI